MVFGAQIASVVSSISLVEYFIQSERVPFVVKKEFKFKS